MKDDLLSSLGLSPKEISIYKAILTAGSVSPATLGRLSGIKRTTAYSIAKGLAEKGLLNEDPTRRPIVFTAATPDEVLGLITREKKLVAEREATLTNFANELAQLSASRTYPVPTVRFVEEAKIADFLRQQTPVWDKNLLATEPTWWGFQDHTFVEHHGDWISWYWDHADTKIDLKLLSNRSPVETSFGPKYAERRTIKFWGEATDFLSTTWAIGDYVVMINTRARPFYLVEIHDKLMAHDQREVFKNLWPLVG